MTKTFYFLKVESVRFGKFGVISSGKISITPCSSYNDAVERAQRLWDCGMERDKASRILSVIHGDVDSIDELVKSEDFEEDLSYMLYKGREYRIEGLDIKDISYLDRVIGRIEDGDLPENGCIDDGELECCINDIIIRFPFDECLFEDKEEIKVDGIIRAKASEDLF